MNYGSSDKHLKFLQENVILPLKKLGCEDWIFGSRSRKEYKIYSDVDLLYQNKNSLNHENFKTELRKIKETLSESNFH